MHFQEEKEFNGMPYSGNWLFLPESVNVSRLDDYNKEEYCITLLWLEKANLNQESQDIE